MNSIEIMSKIKLETLSEEWYFQSLVEQAYLKEMLSNQELENIQRDCLLLLAKQTERYNSGDSSSIRVECAQDILTSILFTMGVWLKTYSNPDEAVEVIRKTDVSNLYENGRKQIEVLMKSVKRQHEFILKNLFHTPNEFYSLTIVDGINGFFKLYYPDFGAQEIHITADYPVHHPMKKLHGIEFIKAYLECIYYENQFCNYFSTEVVHYVLCGYDEHYDQLLFNIYEPILSTALGCILSGANVYDLEMNLTSIEFLKGVFARKTREEILDILKKAVNQLCALLGVSKSLKRYLVESLPSIASAIEHAVLLKTLNRIFIIPRYTDEKPVLKISFGNKMDDRTYCKLVEEIMQCRYIEDKIAMIKSEVHSLSDLEDVLLDVEFNEEEILNVLEVLNASEIAALINRYLIPYELDSYGLPESHVSLCMGLQKYLKNLTPKQQEWMNQAVELLKKSEIV